MQELIKVADDNNERTVSARELHNFLEQTERFSSWFDRMLKYGFIENEDFTGCKVFNTLANQELNDYNMTLDMAKELSMLARSEKGKIARKYFIEIDKKYKQQNPLQMLLNLSKEELAVNILQLSQHIKEKEELIEQQKPAVEFTNRLLKSKDNILIREYAKVLQDEGIEIGEKRLYKWFRENGYLNNKNEPYQRYMKYFVVIEKSIDTPFGIKTVLTTKITPAGQLYFLEKVIS